MFLILALLDCQPTSSLAGMMEFNLLCNSLNLFYIIIIHQTKGTLLVYLQQVKHAVFGVISVWFIIIIMFKRFHDKSTHLSKTNSSNQTYQQINKSKSALKTKYSQKHRAKLQSPQENMTPSLQMLKTDKFLYHGFVRNHQKHGEGIMMLKNGTIIFGTWQQDLLEGRALIFTSLGCKIMTHFILGKFNGWTIAVYKERLVKCILFYENHLDGEKITYDDNQKLWISAKCTYDGKLLTIDHVEKGQLMEPPSFIKSEELLQLISRYIINRERFVLFDYIEQIENSVTSSYIGFVDEERRPSGLGLIYTDKELYCGNFFEGTLEHYGRMLFENGEIYHGEMIGGVFWGQGIYYSPLKNQTHILWTNQYENSIEKELEGYYMIDIVPNIGGQSANSSTGIKGSTLKVIEESFEPYYRKEFGMVKNARENVEQSSSNNSEYGVSEDMSREVKEGKTKDKTTSLAPGKIKPSQRWLKFNEDEEAQHLTEGYKRTYSLDKREAAAMRKNNNIEIIKTKPPNEYQSIQIKQNIKKEQAQDFLKQSPPETKLMQEIQFNPDGFKFKKQSKSLQLQQLNLRNSTLQSLPQHQQQKLKQRELMQRVSENSQSQSSQISSNSQKLEAIIEKNRGYRKKIFY